LVWDTDETGKLAWFKANNLYELQVPLAIDGYTHSAVDRGNTVAVLKHSLINNQWGEVKTAGLVQCQVDIVDGAHDWAGVAEGNTTNLVSDVTGSAYIMNKPSGTGIKWCQVLLNAHHHAASNNPQTDLSSGWNLQNQGDIDGAPATGTKLQVITVNESYVEGANETVRSMQYDAHGHLVLIEEGYNSSSSQSDSSASSSSSQSNIDVSSESSESGAGGDCTLCDPDPVRWLVTLTDFEFDYNGEAFDVSGTYSISSLTGTTATQCTYALTSTIPDMLEAYNYTLRFVIGDTVNGPALTDRHTAQFNISKASGGGSDTIELRSTDALDPLCADFAGATTFIFATGGITNLNVLRSFSDDARF